MKLLDVWNQKRSKNDSVKEALLACDRCLRECLRHQLESEDVMRYFFEEEPQATDHREDLMRLWERIRQSVRNTSELPDCFLLECIYEVDGIWHCMQCEMLTKNWRIRAKKRLELLCEFIDTISNRKEICFFHQETYELREYCRISLSGYDRQLGTFPYYAVRHQLILCMEEGGLAIVVAGFGGLTPQRLFGCAMRGCEFRMCSYQEMEAFRSKVLSPPEASLVPFFPKGRP